jgi:hypothetical protein
MTLKFLAYIDADGHPVIFPALQGTAADANTLVFPSSPYPELFAQIPAGAKVAVFLANLDLESLLVQGRWSGIKKLGLFSGGIIEIDKVYNSMLPLPRYIYPPEEMPCVFGAAA